MRVRDQIYAAIILRAVIDAQAKANAKALADELEKRGLVAPVKE